MKFHKCVICGKKWDPSLDESHHFDRAAFHRLPRHEQDWARQEHRLREAKEHGSDTRN
jgi:hypothetical protein